MFYIKTTVSSSLIWPHFDSIYNGIPSVICLEARELIIILYFNNRKNIKAIKLWRPSKKHLENTRTPYLFVFILM
jgi:hypothetical protein